LRASLGAIASRQAFRQQLEILAIFAGQRLRGLEGAL